MSNLTKSKILGEFYYQMGKDNEELYKPHIESIIGTCNKTIQRYALMDFINDKCYAELKSRDCWFASYEKTMIGANKISNGFRMISRTNKKVYFFFSYLDEKNGGDDEIARAGTFHRGEPDFKDHYFIKREFLIKVCSVGSEVPMDVSMNNMSFRETHKPIFYKKDKYSQGVCLLKLDK